MFTRLSIWFASRSRETKIKMVIGALVFVIIMFFVIKAAYWKWQYMKELETKVKVLEDEKKILRKEVDDISFQRKILKDDILKKNQEFKELQTQLNQKQNETNKIPSIVRTYPDRKLDSIISNHRHIQRTKN